MRNAGCPPLIQAKIPLAFCPGISYNAESMSSTAEIIIGCILVGLSLASIIGLTLWSGRIIEHASGSRQQTARHLLKELNGNRH